MTNTTVGTNCLEFDPPPSTILTIPPPPMPTFFMTPFLVVGNHSNIPCPLLCNWTTGQEMEMQGEFPLRVGTDDESWFLLLLSAFSLAIFLGTCTTILLLKCRQNPKIKICLQKTASFDDRTYESILFPSIKDNHVLWATLSVEGKHPRTVAVTSNQPKSSSTSINTQQSQNPPPLPPRIPEIACGRNFENDAFADVVVLDDEYSSKNLGKMRISSPLRIENANMPPINFYPTLKRHNYPSFL